MRTDCASPWKKIKHGMMMTRSMVPAGEILSATWFFSFEQAVALRYIFTVLKGQGGKKKTPASLRLLSFPPSLTRRSFQPLQGRLAMTTSMRYYLRVLEVWAQSGGCLPVLQCQITGKKVERQLRQVSVSVA